MTVAAMAFWLFASITVLSGVMVISARNPVHSVLFLILAFFNSAGLFLLLGAEFLAMILIIVYVGAVAVLFLFVVMMLDINFVKMREGFQQYLPVGLLIGGILAAELVLVGTGWIPLEMPTADPELATPTPDQMNNTQALGRLIYTKYVYVFQASGMILMVAMIGAIVLTLRSRQGVLKQDISKQVSRTAKDAIEIKKVKVGEGL